MCTALAAPSDITLLPYAFLPLQNLPLFSLVCSCTVADFFIFSSFLRRNEQFSLEKAKKTKKRKKKKKKRCSSIKRGRMLQMHKANAGKALHQTECLLYLFAKKKRRNIIVDNTWASMLSASPPLKLSASVQKCLGSESMCNMFMLTTAFMCCYYISIFFYSLTRSLSGKLHIWGQNNNVLMEIIMNHTLDTAMKNA